MRKPVTLTIKDLTSFFPAYTDWSFFLFEFKQRSFTSAASCWCALSRDNRGCSTTNRARIREISLLVGRKFLPTTSHASGI